MTIGQVDQVPGGASNTGMVLQAGSNPVSAAVGFVIAIVSVGLAWVIEACSPVNPPSPETDSDLDAIFDDAGRPDVEIVDAEAADAESTDAGLADVDV
ncbi:MAG: hypothetical protein KJ811_00860, partial [Candidatus Margulisbacteria bacterium]|nr:hypothetical protein [Candidatus Margulisiibacteriota bacterium]